MLSIAILLTLSILSAMPGPWQAPAPSRFGTSTGGATMMLSPAVVATWITARQPGQGEQLELLVLWRGATGWFLRPGGSNVSERSSRSGQHHVIVQGGITLTLDVDASKQTATVHGNTVDMAKHNVVFVDEVDSPAGPRVTARMAIPRAMPGSAGQIGPVLLKSPEILAFLRCDATIDDVAGKAMLERLCLTNIGIIPK